MLDDDNDGEHIEDWRPIWLERERATARLIQRCFKLLMDGHETAPEKLHALCKLTWITKGNGEVADNTRSVVIPALEVLLHDELSATDKPSLRKELLEANTPTEIIEATGHDVGFVNFYSAFRNTSQEWIAANRDAVWNALSTAATARNDADAQRAYRIVDKLPSLPRRNGGDLPAFNLLTPVLACLDPRERSPVINSREAVKHRLRRLGLAHGTLVEQFDGLVNLINQAGLDGALALDTAADDALEAAFQARRAMPEGVVVQRPATSRSLGPRQDEDIEFLRAEVLEQHRLLHNKMTNALLGLCQRAGLPVDEGREKSNLFDALLRHYMGTERDLLVELKTSHAPAFCRLAVGQLLDYRRQLDGPAFTDIAVLFPEPPDQHAKDFLGFVGAKVVWFSQDMARIEGDVILKGAIMMRAEAVKLGQALLDHHQAATASLPPHSVKRLLPGKYTIPYARLCEQAGVPHVLRTVGSFLGEVAEWCASRGYPPLNSLAVNGTTRLPGDGYDGAGGFHIVNWPANVEQCIRFTGYPATFP